MKQTDEEKKGVRNIILLGLVSCFADISTEMVYPLIPLYLTAVCGATPALVGIIEGIAESIASLLKVGSGYISDRFRHKKVLTFAGYSTVVFYKIALLLASSWTGVLAARVIDRFGKGIRAAPRDVMVSESADKKSMGKAFGLHKMLDMAGSSAGILLAYLLSETAGVGEYRMIFLLSLLPAAAALLLFPFIHEKKGRPAARPRGRFRANLRRLDGRLKLYLFVTFLFTLGNSSNAFLLLRASDAGFTGGGPIFLYFLSNLIASVLSIPCGKLSDRVGRKRLLVSGYLLFSLVYFGFAFCDSRLLMVLIFAGYGLFTAMTAGVERAFIAEIAPPDLKGTMLGLHSTLAGAALLPASVIAGFLWDAAGAFAPFVYGGALSLLAAGLLAFFLRPAPRA